MSLREQWGQWKTERILSVSRECIRAMGIAWKLEGCRATEASFTSFLGLLTLGFACLPAVLLTQVRVQSELSLDCHLWHCQWHCVLWGSLWTQAMILSEHGPALPVYVFSFLPLISSLWIFTVLGMGITSLYEIDMVSPVIVVKKEWQKGLRRDQIFQEPEVLYLFYQVQKFCKSIIYW